MLGNLELLPDFPTRDITLTNDRTFTYRFRPHQGDFVLEAQDGADSNIWLELYELRVGAFGTAGLAALADLLEETQKFVAAHAMRRLRYLLFTEPVKPLKSLL